MAVGAIAHRKLEVKRGRYMGSVIQWPCVVVVVRVPRESVLYGRKKKRLFAVAVSASDWRLGAGVTAVLSCLIDGGAVVPH